MLTMQILILLIVTVLTIFGLINAQSPATKLKFIQVIFRHGQRAPGTRARRIYPLDPYVNETWYPEGWSGLNNLGKKSAYELGRFLRERYGKLIGDVYLMDNVEFQSSNSPRVIMSTQLVAAALFPPTPIQRWDPEMNWQPIPVYSEPQEISKFSRTKFMCPNHEAMRRELERTNDHLINRVEELSEFFKYISNNVGTNVSQEQLLLIDSQLNAQLSQNLELPQWTEGYFPNGKLEEIAAYDYIIDSYNKSMIKMNGGIWIKDWLENVDRVLNGSSQQTRNFKACFMGGHEATVASTLIALGVFEPHVPFYNSAVIFELLESENEFYVKVLYRNRGILQELLIPGCGNINCPLTTFRQLFADIIAEDSVALCEEI